LGRLANLLHEAHVRSLREGLRHARITGQSLLEAKECLSDAEWPVWLKDHIPFSAQEVDWYMMVAARWEKLLGPEGVEPDQYAMYALMSLHPTHGWWAQIMLQGESSELPDPDEDKGD
jgi:hypothetical protein